MPRFHLDIMHPVYLRGAPKAVGFAKNWFEAKQLCEARENRQMTVATRWWLVRDRRRLVYDVRPLDHSEE